MPTIQASDLHDLTVATLAELGEMHWTDLTTDIHEFHMMPQLLEDEKVVFTGGDSIVRNVATDPGNNAGAAGLFEVDNVNISDGLTTVTIPWRHVKTAFAIERREIAMNAGKRKILDLYKFRRHQAMVAMAIKMEQYGWTIATGEDDGLRPFGVPYWINKYAAGSTTPSFSGTLPWANTYPGGLNHSRWKNWAGQYSTADKSDLIPKMRETYRQVRFKAPKPSPSYDQGKSRYSLYCGLDLLQDLETVGENQNENLGRDIASMDGEIVFRGRPIRWVDTLDSDSHAPLYFIDWATIYFCFLDGEYMAETICDPASNQHTTQYVYYDCSYNLLCHNVRANAVLSTGTDKS